jgi:hypothetical protein
MELSKCKAKGVYKKIRKQMIQRFQERQTKEMLHPYIISIGGSSDFCTGLEDKITLIINHNIDPTSIINNKTLSCYWKIRDESIMFRGDSQRPSNGELSTIKRDFYLDSIDIIIFGDDFNQPLDNVVCPERLNEIHFGGRFNQPIDKVKFPESLREIYFGDKFNQPIDKVKFPASLHHIFFGKHFNQPIENVKWPEQLCKISFGDDFNQPIEKVKWYLTHIFFGKHFNQPIENVEWTEQFHKISFGEDFNQPIENVKWPKELRYIVFSKNFNQDMSLILCDYTECQSFDKSNRPSMFKEFENKNKNLKNKIFY